MSQENVELAQRMYAMGLAGDIDAALEFVADDVVVTDLNAPIDEARVFRGRAALGARLAGYRELVDDFRREVEEWLDAGDWVITIGHWRGRAKASGVEIEGRGVNAARWQDGKIVEWIMNFPTKQAALEAVGLREQAMSKENVEVVRSLYGLGGDAFLNAGADAADRAFRDHLDEQFEVRLPSDYPEGEPVFRGRAGVEEMFAMLADTWGKWRFELDRFVDAGERVVVFVRILAEGGASGVPIERETTHVWTIRGGRAVSMHVYRDRSRALEAVGLSE